MISAMNDAGFNNIFDIIEALAGAYIIYSGIRMRSTGILPSQLVGKDIDIYSSRDPKGFIKTMFPVYMISGGLFLGLGAASLYMDNYADMPLWANLTITGVLLLTCIVFAVLTRMNEKKYLR